MAHKYLSSSVGDLKYAYSFKKIVSGYAGNCVQVRRASDDTTSNIGFSGDDLDSATLNAFISGTTGYIVTWYDQTGTVNLVQATNADQPQIVEKDGEWTAFFDNSSSTMQLENGSALTTATNSILHCVWRAPGTYPGQLTGEFAGFQYGSTDQQFKPWGDAGNAPVVLTSGGGEIQTSGVWDDGQWRQHQVHFYNGTCTPYECGSKIFDASARTNPTMAHFYVGGNGTDNASMWLTEVAWFDEIKDQRQIWRTTKNNYQSLFEVENLFLHIGDSLTSGTRVGNGEEWTYDLHSSQGTTRWHVRGYSGYSVVNWNDTIQDLIHFGRARDFDVTGTHAAIVWAGTNDMAGVQDGTQTFTELKGLVQALKQNRFGVVGVVTCMVGNPTDRGASFEARRTVYNNLIKNDTSGDFSFVVDLDTNPNLTDYTDTTYFNADGVHLNPTGAAEVASMVDTALDGITLSNFTSGSDMAITFALRGDSENARYSTDGNTPGKLGPSNRAAVTTDEAGINGSSSIDMVGAGSGVRQLLYNGRANTPANRTRSILMRVKFASTASLGLFNLGVMTRNPANYIGASTTAGSEIIVYTGNNSGATDSGTTTSAGLGTSAWHDIVVTWDGGANLDVWVDGVRRLQDTGITRTLDSPFLEEDQLAVSHIMLGGNFVNFNSHYSVDEFVVWDEVIDPTSVTLTSGSGSLNGSSRAAYVDVAASDGSSSAGGGGGPKLGGSGFGC